MIDAASHHRFATARSSVTFGMLCLCVCSILLVSRMPASATSEAEASAKLELFREQFAAARAHAARVPELTSRADLLALIDTCELEAACDRAESALVNGAGAAALPQLAAVLANVTSIPESSATLARARALVAVCSSHRDKGSSADAQGLLVALDAARKTVPQALDALAKSRQAASERIAQLMKELTEINLRLAAQATAGRVSNAVALAQQIDQKVAELNKVGVTNAVYFETKEYEALSEKATAAMTSAHAASGLAIGQMFYLQRNIGEARRFTDIALAKVPTDRKLIELKTKIEEWNTRHRLMGDNPNR